MNQRNIIKLNVRSLLSILILCNLLFSQGNLLACSNVTPIACMDYFNQYDCGEGEGGPITDKAIDADTKNVCNGGGDAKGFTYCNTDIWMSCNYTDEYTDCDGTVVDTPECDSVKDASVFGTCPSSGGGGVANGSKNLFSFAEKIINL